MTSKLFFSCLILVVQRQLIFLKLYTFVFEWLSHLYNIGSYDPDVFMYNRRSFNICGQHNGSDLVLLFQIIENVLVLRSDATRLSAVWAYGVLYLEKIQHGFCSRRGNGNGIRIRIMDADGVNGNVQNIFFSTEIRKIIFSQLLPDVL